MFGCCRFYKKIEIKSSSVRLNLNLNNIVQNLMNCEIDRQNVFICTISNSSTFYSISNFKHHYLFVFYNYYRLRKCRNYLLQKQNIIFRLVLQTKLNIIEQLIVRNMFLITFILTLWDVEPISDNNNQTKRNIREQIQQILTIF